MEGNGTDIGCIFKAEFLKLSMCAFKLGFLFKECLCEVVYIFFRKVCLTNNGSLYCNRLYIFFNAVIGAGGNGIC